MWSKSYWSLNYWSHSYWSGQQSSGQTVSSTITLSQTIAVQKVGNRSVLSTLTFTFFISSNEQIEVLAPQILALTQSYKEFRVLPRSLSQGLALSQTIVVNKKINLSYQSNLVLVQTYLRPIFRNLSFTSNLNIVQSISGGDHLKQTVLQSLHLVQDLATNKQFTYHVTSTLSFTQRIALLSQTVKQTLSLTQHVQQPNYHITQNLVFNQTITTGHSVTRSLSDHLNLTQTAITGAPHYLNVSSHLTFNEPYYSQQTLLNNTILQIPVVIGLLVPRKYCVRLKPTYNNTSSNQEILLNCPLFGDSEAGSSIINTKRTMTGRLYSYAKKTTNRKLKYTFLLDRNKSLELRDFVKRHLSDLLYLDNWKGERWFSYIISNPTTLIPKSRGVYCDNKGISQERVQVELEFIASRIN